MDPDKIFIAFLITLMVVSLFVAGLNVFGATRGWPSELVETITVTCQEPGKE